MRPSAVLPFPHPVPAQPVPVSWRDGIVAESAAMQRLLDLVERVAPTTLPVLLQGETGVGKEVIARAIHEASGRSGAFVACNCAAIPKELAEAELFGHNRGAFTGATDLRQGLFEQAHEGTLFLDEAGELELPLQAKLLRVLEDGLVRRVGSPVSFSVSVRIVAATNTDLAQAVERRHFRDDLFHRLAGVILDVPPLRERPEDIPPLVALFLEEAIREGLRPGSSPPALAPGVIPDLMRRPWFGNVREVRQAVRRAVVLGGDTLVASDFVTYGRRPPTDINIEAWLVGRSFAEIERFVLESALRRAGSIRAAAVALGLPKSTLTDRVRSLGIAVPTRALAVESD